MQIIQAPSPNYSKGRQGKKPIAIVNHITAGLMPGCLSWLRNPKAKVSAHYLVTKKGEIYQLVADDDTAYANGNVRKPNWSLYDGTNPNGYTLSIEHEGLAGDSLSEEQYQATLWLHRLLVERYQIPVNSDHIIGHCRIDSVVKANCPGWGFPWARLFNDLKATSSVTPTMVDTIIKANDKVINGVMIDNVNYVSVRALAEALGKTVTWDEPNKTVIVK